jgi:hypothetical protein
MENDMFNTLTNQRYGEQQQMSQSSRFGGGFYAPNSIVVGSLSNSGGFASTLTISPSYQLQQGILITNQAWLDAELKRVCISL